MLPHQYRVVREKTRIDENLGRLRRFISSPVFLGVDEAERLRLQEQADLMGKLSDVLDRRIQSFTDGSPVSLHPQAIVEDTPTSSKDIADALHSDVPVGQSYINAMKKEDDADA